MVSSEPEAILYHPRVVWQPNLADVRRPDPSGRDSFSRGLQYIYESRSDPSGAPAVTVFLDEAHWSAPVKPNPMLPLLVCSGMGRGIGVWSCTQRRYRVFTNLFSDAIHVISFRLQNRNDLAQLENDLSVSCKDLPRLEDYEWLYHRQGERGWSGPHLA